MASNSPASALPVVATTGASAIPDFTADEIQRDAHEYAELRRQIRKKGFLDKQPTYYFLKVPLTVAMVAASIAFLVLVDGLWLQLANAAFLGVVFSQLGLLGHDAGHQQIFSSRKKNDLVGLMVGFLMALLPSWW